MRSECRRKKSFRRDQPLFVGWETRAGQAGDFSAGVTMLTRGCPDVLISTSLWRFAVETTDRIERLALGCNALLDRTCES